MKKRGLSAVITTLIIILLVLVAVGVIWVVIKNIISEGVEGVFLGKLTVDLEIKNVNVGNENISVRVKRNPGQGDLSGIKFVVSDGTNTEVVEKTTSLKELGEDEFILSSNELEELNISNTQTVSIAPIYITGSGKESIGGVIDTYEIIGGGECIPETCLGLDYDCGIAENGCEGTLNCGTCGTGYYCASGTCVFGSCTPDCSCASTICIGRTCIDPDCTTLCSGTLQPNCGTRICGPAPNGCGSTDECGICGVGESCVDGTCIITTCLQCTDCDTIFGTCDYVGCHSCGGGPCYYLGSIIGEDCVLLNSVCGISVNTCSDYSDEECTNDACNLDCEFDGTNCVAGCTPDTCNSLGYNCGSWSDGCTGTLNCGTCNSTSDCISGICTLNAIKYVESITGLVSWWRFEGDTQDEVGDNDGVVNGAVLTTGKFGQAYDFDGVDDFIQIAHSDEFLMSDGTIIAWFNANLIPITSEVRGIFSKDSSGFDTGGHIFLGTQYGKLYSRLQNTTTNELSSNNLQANNWYQGTLSFGSQGYKMYINAGLINQSSHIGGMQGNYEPLVFGANTWTSGDLTIYPLQGFFDGTIDEVMIFNRALSATEIQELYELDLS